MEGYYKKDGKLDDGLDLNRIFLLILRNWFWVLISLGIGLVGAWFYLRYTSPIYNISAKVLINDEVKSSLSQEILFKDIGVPNSSSNVLNEVEVLRSTNLLRKVVDSLGLYISYLEQGRIVRSEKYKKSPIVLSTIFPINEVYGKDIEVIPLDINSFQLVFGEKDSLTSFFGEEFLIDGITFKIDLTKEKLNINSQYIIQIREPKRIAKSIVNDLKLSNESYTDVIQLDLESPNPDKAIDILFALIHIYNESVIEEKISSGKKTLEFIDNRLRIITADLDTVEQDVESFRESRKLSVDIQTKANSYMDNLKAADVELSEIQVEEDFLSNIIDLLQTDSGEYELLPLISTMQNSSNLLELINEYNKTVFEREQTLESATEANPFVITMDEKLQNIRKNLFLTVGYIQSDLASRRETIEQKVRPVEREMSAFPGYEREFLQIMRKQQVKEQLFLFLLQKREETSISVAAEVSNSKLIDNPDFGQPISPKPFRIYVTGILFGLLLPVSLIFFKEIFDNKVYTRKDIESVTNTPFLGQIPLSKNSEVIVVKKSARSTIAEMFRLLRTNLNYLGKGSNTKKVTLVTSSVSGEGKTFITVNLGISLAIAGKKTILLGYDLRKPKLSSYINNTNPSKGISSYLVGEATLDEIISPIENQPGLDFIGSGPIPPNPSELIINNKSKELVEELLKIYDVILIDTAPVGLVTDALLLKDLVDQSIIVMRHSYTEKAALQMINDLYQNKKLPNMGIVLNGMKSGYGGYGYDYGYGYGYGYGYYE